MPLRIGNEFDIEIIYVLWLFVTEYFILRESHDLANLVAEVTAAAWALVRPTSTGNRSAGRRVTGYIFTIRRTGGQNSVYLKKQKMGFSWMDVMDDAARH